MLSGALFYVALIALVAATILSTGLAMTRMTITRMMQPYVAAGYERAAASLQQTIAADMQAGGIPSPAPTFAPLSPTCANASCTYLTSETIALTQTGPSTSGVTCDPAQTNCAPNVQANAYIAEGRVTARITVNVQDRSGAVLAERAGDVVLRTFKVAPYASIAGSRDGTFDDVTASHAAGDDGGAPPATPNPCASASAGIADNTTVRVAYRNQATSACVDGSSWSNSSYSQGAAPGGWSP